MPKTKIEDKFLIDLPHETKKVTITRNGANGTTSISEFKHLTNARDIRESKVRTYLSVLEKGKPLKGVWTVNIRKNKQKNKRLVDANHRKRAVEDYLVRHPLAKIVVELHIYKDLTDDDERILFTETNDNSRQTTSDFLKQYWDVLNIQKKINTNGFPLRIDYKTSSNALGLHTIFQPYITRNEIPYSGAYGGSAIDFIKLLRSWNRGKNNINVEGNDAYLRMNAFLKDYVFCFGNFNKNNIFWKAPVLFPLFRIWHENVSHVNVDFLRTCFKKLTKNGGLERVRYWKSMGAPRGNCEKAIVDYLREINGNRTRQRLFITTSRWIEDINGTRTREQYKVFGV